VLCSWYVNESERLGGRDGKVARVARCRSKGGKPQRRYVIHAKKLKAKITRKPAETQREVT